MDFDVTDFNVRLRTIRIRDLALALIVAFFVAVAIYVAFPVIENNEDLVVLPFLIVLLLFFAWALRGTHGLKNNFSKILERDNRREILYIFAVNLIFAFIFVALISNLDIFMNYVYPDNVPMPDFVPEVLDTSSLLLEILSSIIIAPVLEELLFRGVLLNRLKIRIGIIPAILVSSGIFALGHEFGGITSAFVFGICMCIIYLKTDNILMSMSIHFLNNLLAVFLETTGIDQIFLQMPLAPLTLALSTISGLLILLYILENFKSFRA
ncbi:CPBP family intramembrane glutamic endopeptidase [Methanobrevibacter sp.]|uniref:CPBP family intramembrane glutamic endopeptidase n=1 Tax=Methanobrevibacter sp. TaxID=66852 RepID=UPI00388D8D77